MSGRHSTPFELLLPRGHARGALVLGGGCPSRLAPATNAPAPVDLAVVAPGDDERHGAWAARAAATVERGLRPDGAVVVLAPPLARVRIVRSLERRGFRIAGAFLHLPSFARTVFVVPLRGRTLRYVLGQLIARPSWRRSLARVLIRAPAPLLRLAMPSVAVWLRRDARTVEPEWLGVRDAVVQLGSEDGSGAAAIVHGFRDGTTPSVVAKVRADRAQPSPNAAVTAGAAAAGVSVPILVRRVELGGVEATVERALPGRPAASMLAEADDAAVFAFLDELTAWLRRWSAATAGPPLSADRLRRETVDRAVALEPVLGEGPAYVERLRALFGRSSVGRVVAAHNDLTTWNVLVDDGRLAVLDWDEAEAEGLPLSDFAYAALDASTVAGGGDRVAAFGRCFGGGGLATYVEAQLRRLSDTAGLTAETAELCLHACWLRHATNELDRGESPTPFLDVVREIARGLPVRSAPPA